MIYTGKRKTSINNKMEKHSTKSFTLAISDFSVNLSRAKLFQ